MARIGLMTDTEIVEANNFMIAEDTVVDAMAWSWAAVATKIVFGYTGAFL